ncbi:hypothetical protein RMSM_06824 [Rhodopirellula maiorica SM1]|uniref:Uncharacterized protein n=1 Tax=Rhodopirellula maiorica SM1 TaxID=1265738 RepID=M5RLJ8_9BACT|nr:hypothetical protein RMSM_06824 [Rhodopirellula maiorica SM1]
MILALSASLETADDVGLKTEVPDENAQSEKVALINEIYHHGAIVNGTWVPLN